MKATSFKSASIFIYTQLLTNRITHFMPKVIMYQVEVLIMKSL